MHYPSLKQHAAVNEPSDEEKAQIEQLKRDIRAHNIAQLEAARKPKPKVRGVTWNKKYSCWRAQFQIAGVYHDLGLFRDESEAIAALEAARAGGPITRRRLGRGKEGKPSSVPMPPRVVQHPPEPTKAPTPLSARPVEVSKAIEPVDPEPVEQPQEEAWESSSSDPLDLLLVELETTCTVVETLRPHAPDVGRRILETILARLSES